MPPKGKSQTINLQDVAVIAIVLIIMVVGVMVVFGVDLGDLQWEVPESRPAYTVSFTSGGNEVSFDTGYFESSLLSNDSHARIIVTLQVFCDMVNGSYFELGELKADVWTNITMSSDGNKTYQTEIEMFELQSRTFALFYVQPERTDVTCRFMIEDYKGDIWVRPVGGEQ